MSTDHIAMFALDQRELRQQPGAVRRVIANLDSKIGTHARHIIATAKSADPFTIQPERDASLRQNQLRSHSIIKRHVSITGDRLQQLQSLLLNPANLLGRRFSTYDLPDVAIRFVSTVTLPVLFDLTGCGMWIHKDSGDNGMPDAWFSPVAAQMVQLLASYRIASQPDSDPAADIR